MAYVYRINNTGQSSHYFGPCEICKLHANSVFLQVEEKEFLHHLTQKDELSYVSSRFGHEDCLVKARAWPKSR